MHRHFFGRRLVATGLMAPVALMLGLVPVAEGEAAASPATLFPVAAAPLLGQAGSGAPSYSCVGSPTTLFNDTNPGAVSNWGSTPMFSTSGTAYCLVQLITYHWNGGRGAKPGSIALTSPNGATLGPFNATGSSGQGGAPDVNWTATVSASKSVVMNGTYSCVDSDPATWSQNSASAGKGFCKVIVKKAVSASATVKCSGPQLKLFGNSNIFGVLNGAKPPRFSTKGVAYCLTQLITYHWNNGLGAKPGTIGLASSSGTTLGPFTATGSSGQGNAPNVNWTANVPTSPKPVVINGTYSCIDSSPATWSQNTASGGKGFCTVYGVKTVTSGTAGKGTGTGKGGKSTGGKAATPKCKAGKLGIAAAPSMGKPPLTVTFALCSPKAVQWRVDYGDGQSKVGPGSPPKLIVHTYLRTGYYRPALTTLAAPGGPASVAATSVSVQFAQLASLTPKPSSGPAPLRIIFTMGTTVKNITSWGLDFGDGQRTAGAGRPPAKVGHTYAKDGNYTAVFTVKPGQYALVSAYAGVTVGNGAPPVLSLSASPASGAHPLRVTFTLATTIPGRVVSWLLVFGDGSRQSGSGQPPAKVAHTYLRAGTFAAYLQVAQQQQYGPVLYVVPRGGLLITVR